MALIECRQINVQYDRAHVLRDVDLELQPGEVVCILGRNGAGKTTTLKALAGWLHPTSGTVLLDGHDITAKPPENRAHRGLAFVPEDRRIFSALTVDENLRLGLQQRRGMGRRDGNTVEQMYEWFPSLVERRKQLGRVLSGGEQQMLTIARALVGDPRVLLIDEPSEGLAPRIVATIFESIKRMKAKGMGVLLVEQNAHLAAAVADRCYVMEKGRMVVQCEPSRVLADSEIRQRLAI